MTNKASNALLAIEKMLNQELKIYKHVGLSSNDTPLPTLIKQCGITA